GRCSGRGLLGCSSRRGQASNLARVAVDEVAGQRDQWRVCKGKAPSPVGSSRPPRRGGPEARFVRKLPLLARLAGYRMAHATGTPKQLPVNLTVSVTYSCPSRCGTCDIWRKKVDDLSV